MSDDKRTERRDDDNEGQRPARRHLGQRHRGNQDEDVRFDTGDENRMINEPSRELVAGLVPDEIAKEQARRAFAEGEKPVIGAGVDEALSRAVDEDPSKAGESRTESRGGTSRKQTSS